MSCTGHVQIRLCTLRTFRGLQYIFFSSGNITSYMLWGPSLFFFLLGSFHVLDEHTVSVAWETAGRCGIELHDVGYVYYLSSLDHVF